MALTSAHAASDLDLYTRTRIEKNSNHVQVMHRQVRWAPERTAVIICDMWNDHWCKGASARVAEMAPRMNEVVSAARKRGVFIVHAPSDVMEFYKDTPQRKRAQNARGATPPSKIERWRRIDREKEGPFPIDDSDGGCDDSPRCKEGPPYPWKRQISTIEIADQDAITDSGQEAFNLMEERGITNVIVMGVHANMCVLGRSFAIRQMVLLGRNVVLMRDMTDTMYNSRARPQVKARHVSVPETKALEEWIARETKLGNATLAAEVKGGNKGLEQVKRWSDAVNAQVEDIVHGVPPFPLVTECLERINQRADAMCISQTPADALKREWAGARIDQHVKMIAGQEMGTKTEHLKFAAKDKYAPAQILMIGDAPGDFKAAKGNSALFFPINPGREEESWQRLHQEALDRFFKGTYAGEYEAKLVKEFDACLPEDPHW